MSLKDLPDGPTILSVSDLQALADAPAVTNKEHTRLRIEDLTLYPGNARRSELEPIAASLKKFGQFAEVLVQRSTGHILIGNHRTRAASEILGWTEIDVCVADVDDDHARAIVLADNKLGEMGTYDTSALSALLEDTLESVGLEATGYGFADMTAIMLAAKPPEPSEEWGEDRTVLVNPMVSKSFQVPAEYADIIDLAIEKASEANVPVNDGGGKGWALVRLCEAFLER